MSSEPFPAISPPSGASKLPAESGIFRGSIRRLLGIGLMYLVVLEAALLGSGQLLRFGPVSFKMLLFALSMSYLLLSCLCGSRVRRSTLLLCLFYFVSVVGACLVGLLRDAPLVRMGRDISPLLSFLLLPFFELTVQTERQVARVIWIIMLASGVITGAYIAIILSLWTGYLSYAELASLLGSLGPSTGMGDFLFDESTERVFYKGAIYLAIALVFFIFHRRRWATFAALFMALNLIAIGARGFFLALFVTGLVYLLIGPIRTTRKVALILPVILAGVFLLPRLFMLAGDRSDSNRERIVTASQVLDRADYVNTIVGNGFGLGVPERPEHMEIVPLEVFSKQGLFGLCWWMAFVALFIVRFRNAVRSGNAYFAYPFFLSSVFIAVESCTNPYINNPIGMTFVTLALACLRILGSGKNVDSRAAGAPAGGIFLHKLSSRSPGAFFLDPKEGALG